MKKIAAVLWHNSANRLNMLQSQTDEFVCLKVYSAAALSDGRQDLDKLYRDMDDADAFLFQVTSSDSAWIEIEEYAEKFETPMIYVGGESAGKIKTKDQMKHSAICNQFYVYSGAENMVNMMKYICSQVLHEEMDYQEPIFIPWEGIFHPDSKEIFQSTKDYFAWKEPFGKGTIALLGVSEYAVPINTRMVLEKGLHLYGSSRSGRADFEKTVELYQEYPEILGYLSNIVGAQVEVSSIADMTKAFEMDINKMMGKTIMIWNK